MNCCRFRSSVLDSASFHYYHHFMKISEQNGVDRISTAPKTGRITSTLETFSRHAVTQNVTSTIYVRVFFVTELYM